MAHANAQNSASVIATVALIVHRMVMELVTACSTPRWLLRRHAFPRSGVLRAQPDRRGKSRDRLSQRFGIHLGKRVIGRVVYVEVIRSVESWLEDGHAAFAQALEIGAAAGV